MYFTDMCYPKKLILNNILHSHEMLEEIFLTIFPFANC